MIEASATISQGCLYGCFLLTTLPRSSSFKGDGALKALNDGFFCVFASLWLNDVKSLNHEAHEGKKLFVAI